MRHPFVVGLSLIASSLMVGADKPIPQDLPRMEKQRAERLEWNRKSIVGAYDAVGKRSPKWDDAAHEALELAVRMAAEPGDSPASQAAIHGPARKAIEAGCDDPLIFYYYACSSVDDLTDEYARRHQAVAVAMAASPYPPYRHAMASLKAGEAIASRKHLTAERKRDAERMLDAAIDFLPRSVAAEARGEVWEDKWYRVINSAIETHRRMSGDYKAAFDRVDARLAKVNGIEALRLLVEGNFQLHWGWETRTTAFAPLVSDKQFRILEARLKFARVALERARKANPDEPHVARLMLDIEKGIGGGDRPAMEAWFERAMQADGDDRVACWSKLDWLDPKWYGDKEGEQMLAFGRACRDTRNWRSGITLLVADAHWRHARIRGGQEQAKYMGLPEVWADIKPVYEEYLGHYPNDDVARSKFATLAYMTGHFPEAHAQYEALGDRLTQWPDAPYIPIEVLKKNRSEVARYIANNRKAGWHRLVVKNEEGRWSVAAPAATERKKEAGILGAERRNVWTCTAGEMKFAVRVQPIPPALADEKPTAVLDAMRSAVAGQHGGRSRDEHPARLAENPAREYTIDAPSLRPQVVRVRSAVIGKKVYELSVTANEAAISGQAPADFFDSFTYQK